MRLAVAQLAVPPTAEGARRVTGDALAAAAGQGADLVVLPELAACGYVLDRDVLTPLADGPDGGPVTDVWRARARDHGMVVVGGVAERDGEHLYNALVVIDRAGEVVGRYRKLHLFGAERDVFTPGDLGLPVVEVDGVRLGGLICYDLRFVEALRVLALQGADLVVVPTAWVAGFDRAAPAPGRWIGQVEGALVQANLNQVWLACAGMAGGSGALRFLGSSVVVDPYGAPALGPLPVENTTVAVVDIDPAEARRAQDRGPGISPRSNRRPDVYGPLLGYRPGGPP